MSKKINNRVISHTDIQHYIPEHSTIIVGLSGGPDSVCLLHMLYKLKEQKQISLIAAHLDHQWRSESLSDRLWCQNLCSTLNIPFVYQNANSVQLPKYNGSKEEVGRILRRNFFEQIAQKNNSKLIALAHHQDDQIETFFIRLIRGASIAGLGGIKPVDGIYIRPLLSFSKKQILNYLKYHQIEFVTDQSNQQLTFLRNRIRHQLLISLNNIDHRALQAIPHCMKQLETAYDFIKKSAIDLLPKISQINQKNRYMRISDFLNLHETLQQEIMLILMIEKQACFTPSQKLFKEIIRFLKATKSNKHMINTKIAIIKKHSFFYFDTL